MNVLQTRVLGLPAWAWGAIIGVGVVGFAYMRSRAPSPDPTSAGDAALSDAPPVPIDDASMESGGYYPGPIGGVGGGHYGYAPPPTITTAQLDAKTLKQLQELLRLERLEHKHKRKRRRHPVVVTSHPGTGGTKTTYVR